MQGRSARKTDQIGLELIERTDPARTLGFTAGAIHDVLLDEVGRGEGTSTGRGSTRTVYARNCELKLSSTQFTPDVAF